MRKLIALLLVIIMSFSLFACGNGGDTSGDASSVTDSVESVDTDAEPDEAVKKINDMFNVDIDRTLRAKNIFAGLKYEFSRETNDTYVDTKANKLTDGIVTDVFNKYDFVGWDGAGKVDIFFDLGEGEHALAEVNVGCLREMSYGIGLPAYVEVSASRDGENYVAIGRMLRQTDIRDSDKQEYHLSFPKATDARYIKITCGRQDNSFLFIDEIAGYEYCEDGKFDLDLGSTEENMDYIRDYYGYNLDIANVTVNKNDSDYNTVQNLARLDGVGITAQHFDPIPVDNNSNTVAKDLVRLIDGVTPEKASYTEKGWAVFYRGAGRHVVIDLGQDMAISGYKAVFLEQESVGVAAPPASYISLSSDGENWVTVYGESSGTYGQKQNRIYTINADFGKEYKARYARITFPTVPNNFISSMVFVGEIEVIGRKNTESAVEPVENTDSPYGRFAMPDSVGCDNILFAPLTDGYGNHMTENFVFNYDTAMKYLARLDDNGNPTDVFYDSVGIATRGELNDHTERYDGTLFYLSELFDYEDLNLSALNKAKGDINKALGRDEKLKIWISVNDPADGDTFKGERVDTLDKTVECIKWQIDETLRQWNKKDYVNLEFVGFYWQYECFRENAYDYEAAKQVNEYIHKLGYLSFWCPYYSANGIWLCHDAGFDVSCLQPNYMFYNTTGENRLETTAELAKIYGMCVEIEIEDIASIHSQELYFGYLETGRKTGYMQAVKVYYQGGIPGAYSNAYDSDIDYIRRLYDITWKYASATLQKSDIALLIGDLDAFSDATIEIQGTNQKTIEIGDLNAVKYRIVESPIFGDFSVNRDGKVTYKPVYKYKGEEKLILQLLDESGNTKIVTVTIIR